MDNDTTIDIEEVPDIGEETEVIYETQDEYDDIDKEDYAFNVVDYSQTMLDMNKEKSTIPYLTKYERTQLIATRAQQLSMGAVPLVDITGLKKTTDIAEKELLERKLPLIIHRILPNNKYENWRLDDLFYD